MKYIYYICIVISFIKNIFVKKIKISHKKKVDGLKKNIKESLELIVLENSNHAFGLNKLDTKKINISSFNEILNFDKKSITIESSVTIEQILNFLHKKNYTLDVIPDLKHLTIGGIISGIGGGSASFKYGYFHDIINYFELVSGDGKLYKCSENENTDLYYSVPNSLGTFGYITKINFKVKKLKKYVVTRNLKFSNLNEYFNTLENFSNNSNIDFLDGTIFEKNSFVLIVGFFRDEIDTKLDNFINDKIYYESLLEDDINYSKTIDYIYRWDTDLYYTSISNIVPNILKKRFIRRMVPKCMIPKIKQILPYLGIDNDISNICQDVLIPYENMKEFFKWYSENIKLYPIYICPVKSKTKLNFWDNSEFCDFGIGYGINSYNDIENTKKIEQKMIELGGRKLLYTKTFLEKEKFWDIYDKEKYDRIRKKYNCHTKFPDLYSKVKTK